MKLNGTDGNITIANKLFLITQQHPINQIDVTDTPESNESKLREERGGGKGSRIGTYNFYCPNSL